MNIRPFRNTDADYAALLALHKLLKPDEHITIEMRRESDRALSAERDFTRVLGEVDGRVIAHGTYWHTPSSPNEPHQFTFAIHPDHQHGPAASEMHRYLLAQVVARQPAIVVSEPTEDETYRTQQLEADGFTLKMRFPRSKLDVRTFDATACDEMAAQLAQAGIELITLTEVMKRDADWQQNVWRLFTIVDQDVPYPDPQKSVPFEVYKTFYEGELFRSDSWVIAWDSAETGPQRYVGMSVINLMPTKPDTLFAGITGVIPSYRRRKIATALKLQSAKYAHEAGFRYIETDNEEDNPMYQLNLALGYDPLPAWVYYEKKMN